MTWAGMLVPGPNLVHHDSAKNEWRPHMVALGTGGIVAIAIVLVILVVLFLGILRRALRSQR